MSARTGAGPRRGTSSTTPVALARLRMLSRTPSEESQTGGLAHAPPGRPAARVEPDELRVRVRQARARGAALVDRARASTPEPSACARPARSRQASATSCELGVVELGKRAHVPRRVDDNLLPLERRVQVRHDAHRQPASALPTRDVSGRRPVLAARAERALRELGLVRPARVLRLGARPAAPLGATATSRPESGSVRRSRAAAALEPSRNGVNRSIGAGKTIVVECDAADLEQRLQVAQLQRDRVLLDHERRVLQPLGRLVLALGVDHLRAPLALGLRLAGHRALHAARDLDVLHLDDRDLDAPRARSPRR